MRLFGRVLVRIRSVVANCTYALRMLFTYAYARTCMPRPTTLLYVCTACAPHREIYIFQSHTASRRQPPRPRATPFPPLPQMTPASLRSLSTSSSTLLTSTPPLRTGGSTTCSTVSRGFTSTPVSSIFSVSMGFFFAFMMLGSVA